MMNGIRPIVGVVLNTATAVTSGLTALAASFTDLFGQGPSKKIVAATAIMGVVIASVNGGLHAASSTESGPLVK